MEMEAVNNQDFSKHRELAESLQNYFVGCRTNWFYARNKLNFSFTGGGQL